MTWRVEGIRTSMAILRDVLKTEMTISSDLPVTRERAVLWRYSAHTSATLGRGVGEGKGGTGYEIL
jgi:hypothetical protein